MSDSNDLCDEPEPDAAGLAVVPIPAFYQTNISYSCLVDVTSTTFNVSGQNLGNVQSVTITPNAQDLAASWLPTVAAVAPQGGQGKLTIAANGASFFFQSKPTLNRKNGNLPPTGTMGVVTITVTMTNNSTYCLTIPTVV